MKKKKIRELNQIEEINIKGGVNPIIPAGFTLWLGNEIINNWSDVKSGIADAYRDFL